MATTKVRYNQIKTGLPAGGDVNYNDVSLLLNMEGSNGSTTFADGSSSGHSVTANGNASISTSEFKFGSSSYKGDGDNSLLDLAASSKFNFGTADFTVEMFVSFTEVSYDNNYWRRFYMVDGPSGTTTGNLEIMVEKSPPGVSGSTAGAIMVRNGSPIIIKGATAINDGNWHHVAVVNNSGTLTLYIDGSSDGSSSISGNIGDFNSGAPRPRIGAYSSNQGVVDGYVDGVRVTKGLARYTSNFSVPTVAFPAFESKEGKELRVGANGTIELES